MRMLVSVKNVAEAIELAHAGVDFIDLKDPAAGALGGLAPATIRAVVEALRAAGSRARISATIGDVQPSQRAEILARVAAVAACGVDYVKVGIARGAGDEALLAALARCGASVVPVLIADEGIALDLVHEALAHDAFPALMVDTQDKRGGSLIHRRPANELRGFVDTVRSRGVLAGLAGALREADLPALCALAPDFAGFRSAVCASDRAGALERERVVRLRAALDVAMSLHAPGPSAPPSNAVLIDAQGSAA